jgi:hypothetical protein
VLRPWQGGFATVVVTLVTCGLVAGDLADEGFRRWWVNHALTTDTVAGLLVLLVTVLIVDQVVGRRAVRDRSRAIAAQAAILMAQAGRSSKVMSSVLAGSADRGDAVDEVRTYMMMLLVGAPILIDAEISRNFLEAAQRLAGEMAHTLTTMATAPGPPGASAARLSDAVGRLQVALAPLLQVLTPDERELVDTGDGESP